jgi:hypothetical protein
MKIKINKHMWLLKPMHKVYKDDGADEIDHSIWWLCFIVSWVERVSCKGKGCC